MRRFGLRLTEALPDETTILNFRHLLEKHGLGEGSRRSRPGRDAFDRRRQLGEIVDHRIGAQGYQGCGGIGLYP